jgi:eukaryotic-like serine/threonine-protein kinase
LIHTLLTAGRFTEAEPMARECLIIRAKQTPEDRSTFDVQSMLGGILLGQKKYVEAEPLLLSAYEGLKASEDKSSHEKLRRKEAVQRIVQLYRVTGRPEKVAEWNKVLTDAAAGLMDGLLILREEDPVPCRDAFKSR